MPRLRRFLPSSGSSAARFAGSVLVLSVLVTSACDAQRTPRVRRSMPASVMQAMGETRLTITYNRPVARGRQLFGGIVHWDRVWCPGADEATALELSHDIVIGGEKLAAGKYSLWAIPRAESEWTMIFSRAADVFHVPYPGEAQDALRLQVKPTSGPHMEALTFLFPAADSTSATLRFHWGETMLELPIKVP
jgi:hypothetical protein